MFNDENIKVGDTSWMEFKIELKEHAHPVKQKVRPLPPPLKKDLKVNLMNGCAIVLLNQLTHRGHQRWCPLRKRTVQYVGRQIFVFLIQ